MKNFSVVAVLVTSLYSWHQKSDLLNRQDAAAMPASPQTLGQS